MNRRARSFVAVVTALSAACSGRACGGSSTTGTSTAATDATATAHTAPSTAGSAVLADARSIEGEVQALGRVLSETRDQGPLAMPEARTRLRRMYDLLQTVDATLPRDTFDFGEVVRLAGSDPLKLRDWVKTHTALVPYRGTLRGAAGTLMDRLGNSLDRALLLSSLLREMGASSRLARAHLSPAQATALLERIERPAQAPTAMDSRGDAALVAYVRQSGLAEADVQRHLQRVRELAGATRQAAQQRVGAQAEAIAKLAGLSPGDDRTDSTRRTAAIEALQDHWWVQWQNGAAWIDLDPAADGPGGVLATPEQTAEADKLGPDQRHEVEIRIVVERSDGSQFTQSQPLNLVVRAADLIGVPIQLRQVPTSRPAEAAGDTQPYSRSAVLRQREWLPAFIIGTRRVSRASILETGDINERPGSRPNPVASGFFDALGGGGEADRPGVLTAEWIEYEIRVPGRPARTIRREIFDLIGPAARAAGRMTVELTDDARYRRGLALLSETDILLMPAQFSAPFLANLASAKLRGNRPTLESLLGTDQPLSPRTVMERASGLQGLPGPLHGLAATRNGWSRSPDSVFIAEPNIISRHTFANPDGSGASRLTEAFDIVANDVEPRRAVGHEARLARIEQGVLDANAEAWLLGARPDRVSVADTFSEGAANDWKAARSPSDLEGLSLSDDAKARIREALGAGYIAIVPSTSASRSTGWWRVDPRTGSVMTIGDRGWGQATADHVILTTLGTGFLCTLVLFVFDGKYTYRDFIFCGFAALTAGAGVVAAIPELVLHGAIGVGVFGVLAGAVQQIAAPGLDQWVGSH